MSELNLIDCEKVLLGPIDFTITESHKKNIIASQKLVNQKIKNNQVIYGINTGFGLLADKNIPLGELAELQTSLLYSHAAGIGDLLDPAVVRLIILLKLNSLAQGYSGVSLDLVYLLQKFLEKNITPCVPAKGSVGASGDLAPLSYIGLALIGEGEVIFDNKKMLASAALKKNNLQPLTLGPKEGIALINGTQVSTAILISNFIKAKKLFLSLLISGAFSVSAAHGRRMAFHKNIHQIRKQTGQITVANKLWHYLINEDKSVRRETKVQDPYSLRCQPQVMGSCLDQLDFIERILSNEINSVTDNPLVFPEDDLILSGGNFHAAPIAMAADNLAIVLSEMGSLAERRIALLIDSNFSGLAPFLAKKPGLHSGFMLAQVTAAALVSENKALATPVSIDSIPTSANQEDHVSMATYAARRCENMCDNLNTILAIELLACAQAWDLRKPYHSSPALKQTYELIRRHSNFYDDKRIFSKDIEKIKHLTHSSEFMALLSDG